MVKSLPVQNDSLPLPKSVAILNRSAGKNFHPQAAEVHFSDLNLEEFRRAELQPAVRDLRPLLQDGAQSEYQDLH